VIEHVEKLAFDAKFDSFAQHDPFGEIEIASCEVRTSQFIAAEVSELAVLRTISTSAGAGAHAFSLRSLESTSLLPI
jgi:hypothetical protein